MSKLKFEILVVQLNPSYQLLPKSGHLPTIPNNHFGVPSTMAENSDLEARCLIVIGSKEGIQKCLKTVEVIYERPLNMAAIPTSWNINLINLLQTTFFS